MEDPKSGDLIREEVLRLHGLYADALALRAQFAQVSALAAAAMAQGLTVLSAKMLEVEGSVDTLRGLVES